MEPGASLEGGARSEPWARSPEPARRRESAGSWELRAAARLGARVLAFHAHGAERTVQGTGGFLPEPPVPMVFNLSRAFYDRLGDEVVAELVGMLNHVDTASQQSLSEAIDASVAKFDARLERRLGDLRVEIMGEMARLESRLLSQMVSQSRWMMGMWLTLLLATIGLWLRR